MSEFITHRCPLCDGVSHPASGCVYSANFIVCGPCVRRDWNHDAKRGPIGWLYNHINCKGGRSGYFFYEHVTFQPSVG